MTVQDLIVLAVLGHRLEKRYGPRGGLRGFFVGSQRVNARTWYAAKRQGLVTLAGGEQRGADFNRVYQLSEEAAIEAERVLGNIDNRTWNDSRTEHVFTHIVPGVVIEYGPVNASDDTRAWVVRNASTREYIAHQWGFRDAVEAARIVIARKAIERAQVTGENPYTLVNEGTFEQQPAKSWNCEVIADSSGKWVGNGCYFATKDEADRYGNDLAGRWFAVRELRSVECDHEANYTFSSDGLKSIEKAGQQ